MQASAAARGGEKETAALEKQHRRRKIRRSKEEKCFFPGCNSFTQCNFRVKKRATTWLEEITMAVMVAAVVVTGKPFFKQHPFCFGISCAFFALGKFVNL